MATLIEKKIMMTVSQSLGKLTNEADGHPEYIFHLNTQICQDGLYIATSQGFSLIILINTWLSLMYK